jgi:PEGA domain
MLCTARLLVAFCLLTGLMASAATKTERFRITVLDAHSQTLQVNPDTTPRDCDQVNYSGYCHETKVAAVRNTMRVQSGNGKPFDITCVWDSRLSRCVALPIGQSFDARKDKHGITIFYENDKGGASKQLYTVVEAAQAAAPTTSADAGQKNAIQTRANQNSSSQAPVQASSGAIPAPAHVAASQQKVKCSFSSTPPGAEITLDGRFVGSTPSTLGVGLGTHVVVLFMPGFAQWKRELTVSDDSELTVNATLQKTP